MSTILGLNAKLYRGTAGSQASTEVKNVKDVTLNLESGEADVTTRGSNGWKISAATLKEASLEFTLLYDTDDSDFTAFQTAYFGGTPIALFVADRATSGSSSSSAHGLDADFVITGFNIEQPLEDAVSVSITAKPSMTSVSGGTARAPQWV